MDYPDRKMEGSPWLWPGQLRGFFSEFTTEIIFVVKNSYRAFSPLGGQWWSLPGIGREGMAQAGARAAQREVRVVARGRASSHATRRSILIAAAIATCCTWVFARPPYRVRRSPKARTPCERVPSIPARCAYWRWPSALAYHARMAWSASYCSWGGRCRLRALCCARVQAARVGQALQSWRLNCTMIQGLWARSTYSVQLIACFPCGHQTSCRSQSTVNWSTL